MSSAVNVCSMLARGYKALSNISLNVNQFYVGTAIFLL